MCFCDYDCANLENPDTFEEAKSDSKLFLSQFKKGLILDEVQRLPELFFCIQTINAERDLRQIVNVSSLFLFRKLMRLVAGRIGQLLNYNNIANELGVDLKTVKSWFPILETSFIVFFLPPHYQNFSKRLVKTLKLYFYDTGLACSLLCIKNQENVEFHWPKGTLFENMIVADLMKNGFDCAETPPLYFCWFHQIK
jgi:predicted AAA+ superfamily ATPase